jgi:hypothetical protein
MIDTTNKEARYIITPDGKAEIDHFVSDDEGNIDTVIVWMGEREKDAKLLRKHRFYAIEECDETD